MTASELAFSSSSSVYTLINPSNTIFEPDIVKIYSPALSFTEVVLYFAFSILLATNLFQIS